MTEAEVCGSGLEWNGINSVDANHILSLFPDQIFGHISTHPKETSSCFNSVASANGNLVKMGQSISKFELCHSFTYQWIILQRCLKQIYCSRIPELCFSKFQCTAGHIRLCPKICSNKLSWIVKGLSKSVQLERQITSPSGSSKAWKQVACKSSSSFNMNSPNAPFP